MFAKKNTHTHRTDTGESPIVDCLKYEITKQKNTVFLRKPRRVFKMEFSLNRNFVVSAVVVVVVTNKDKIYKSSSIIITVKNRPPRGPRGDGAGCVPWWGEEDSELNRTGGRRRRRR